MLPLLAEAQTGYFLPEDVDELLNLHHAGIHRSRKAKNKTIPWPPLRSPQLGLQSSHILRLQKASAPAAEYSRLAVPESRMRAFHEPL